MSTVRDVVNFATSTWTAVTIYISLFTLFFDLLHSQNDFYCNQNSHVRTCVPAYFSFIHSLFTHFELPIIRNFRSFRDSFRGRRVFFQFGWNEISYVLIMHPRANHYLTITTDQIDKQIIQGCVASHSFRQIFIFFFSFVILKEIKCFYYFFSSYPNRTIYKPFSRIYFWRIFLSKTFVQLNLLFLNFE